MGISVFDIFKVGIGPSSSHTVGPMKAAKLFAQNLVAKSIEPASISVELFGSLGLTGRGHGTGNAVILGLMGEYPETVEVDQVEALVADVEASGAISLLGSKAVLFSPEADLKYWAQKILPLHANGMRFHAFDKNKNLIYEEEHYSIGGGFIASKEQLENPSRKQVVTGPHPFETGEDLLRLCGETGFSIPRLMLENEKVRTSDKEIKEKLMSLWAEMDACIDRGCHNEGVLPGFLKVKRRAPELYRKLKVSHGDPLEQMDWVNLYALAINEENAAGSRVVTSPTNGAAGIIPAVLKYAMNSLPNSDEQTVVRFLLTAGAIAILYKKRSSISGAEVGCQGEVGVACSMAAGALAEVLGGTSLQIENAAEIGMEHNLGLTCDPVGGFVQVPCIERNAMAAIKSINAARLALRGDGQHAVSLDKVILTMKQTGEDMKDKYKETSRGGLAVNIVEC